MILKSIKHWATAAIATLFIIVGMVFFRNKRTVPKESVRDIVETHSKRIEENTGSVETSNTSITQHKEKAEEKAKPVTPVRSKTFEDAIKEWNRE